MKILILANCDWGLYKFRKELVQGLINDGMQVLISVPDGDYIPSLSAMGCHHINTKLDRRGMNLFNDLLLLFHYLKILRQIKPDLVLTYTVKPNIYGGLACKCMKLSYIINITGLGTAFHKSKMQKKLVIRLYKEVCKKAKFVLFENKGNRDVFLKYHITVGKKSLVQNGAGVNLKEFIPCKYPTDEEIHFIYIGRIMKEKGIEELLSAVKLLKSKYNNLVLDVIGPMEEDYMETFKILEEHKIIKYHNFQSDVRPFLEKAHCLVLPSYHEGMANTLLEAASMGKPLITSDIPGCREAVVEGKSGYLVTAADAMSLYMAMNAFLEKSYEEKKSMGEYSRKHMEDNFDRNVIVERTKGIIYQ